MNLEFSAIRMHGSSDPASFFIDTKRSVFPIINGVFHCNHAGLIYKIQSDSGHSYFVLHKSGFGELITTTNYKDRWKDFFIFLNSELELPRYFHLYDFDEEKRDLIPDCFNYKLRKRIKLTFDKEQVNQIFKIAGYRVVSAHNVLKSDLIKSGLNNYLNFWDDFSEFQKESLAQFALDLHGNIVSCCYSASKVSDAVEIDIETVEHQKGKGLAKLVAASFIRICQKKELKISWDCFESNTSSLRVAKSLGFVEQAKYSFLSIYRK